MIVFGNETDDRGVLVVVEGSVESVDFRVTLRPKRICY